jgi:shikimate kinase
MAQLNRTIALVGMMGAGKSSLGRRLAARLAVEFRDADSEIEKAAGCSIPEIFERFGEPEFREGERRVIARLLEEPAHVLATGGGAFMDPDTRARLKARAFSIWIKVPVPLLLTRVKRRGNRPLLKDGDLEETLTRLLAARESSYAQADMILESIGESHGATVEKILAALEAHHLYEGP